MAARWYAASYLDTSFELIHNLPNQSTFQPGHKHTHRHGYVYIYDTCAPGVVRDSPPPW